MPHPECSVRRAFGDGVGSPWSITRRGKGTERVQNVQGIFYLTQVDFFSWLYFSQSIMVSILQVLILQPSNLGTSLRKRTVLLFYAPSKTWSSKIAQFRC